MGSLILKAAISYLQAHPEQVESLVHAAIAQIVAHVDAQKTAPESPK